MINLAFALPANPLFDFVIGIFAFIDSIIYQLFTFVTWGFTSVMNVTLIDNEQLQLIINRFYVVIGIYMLFRLALVLMNTIIDPDKLTDKNAGMNKIITRAVTTLIMFMLVPTLFTFALDIQDDILAVIPKIILGRGETMSSDTNYQIASNIALTTWSAFLIPNESCGASDVHDGTISSSQGGITKFDTVVSMATERCPDGESSEIYKVYKYEYWFLITTIVGLFLTIVMLVYTVNVATRLFKLLVLQILSPIAIFSYIDPSLDKNGPFNSWLKLTIKTYLEVFIKMAVVYFVLALISTALETDGGIIAAVNPFANGGRLWNTLFIIIGGFVFMFGANKFIDKALGLNKDKDKGAFGKLLGTAAIGLVYGGLAGAAGGMVQAGAQAAHDVAGLGKVGSFVKGAFNKDALVNGLASGATKGFAAGQKFSLADSFNHARNNRVRMDSGDPNATFKSFEDIMNDKATLRQFGTKGINKNTVDQAKNNIETLKNYSTARTRYRNNLSSLQSALTKREELKRQSTYYDNLKNNYSGNTSSAEYQDAVANYNRIQSEILGNDQTVNTAYDNIRKSLIDRDAGWDFRKANPNDANSVDGFDLEINFNKNKYDTAESLESLITLVDENIKERNETISELEKRYNEVKPVYKAATGAYKGKPIDQFVVGSSNIKDINPRDKDGNK